MSTVMLCPVTRTVYGDKSMEFLEPLVLGSEEEFYNNFIEFPGRGRENGLLHERVFGRLIDTSDHGYSWDGRAVMEHDYSNYLHVSETEWYRGTVGPNCGYVECNRSYKWFGQWFDATKSRFTWTWHQSIVKYDPDANPSFPVQTQLICHVTGYRGQPKQYFEEDRIYGLGTPFAAASCGGLTFYKVGSSVNCSDLNETRASELARNFLADAYQRHSIPYGTVYNNFVSACSARFLTSNNVANVKDILDMVMKIRKGEIFTSLRSLPKLEGTFKNLVSFFGDAWLTKRYAWDTTKSDLEEFFMKLKSQSLEAGRQTSRSGEETPNGLFHIKVTLDDTCSGYLDQFYKAMNKYGFVTDEYVIWDLVPLSFVVDWFSSFGDYLETNHYDNIIRGLYDVSDIVASWKWEEVKQYGRYGYFRMTHYNRWLMDRIPQIEYTETDPSSGTVLRRFIDGVSLIFQ